MSLSVHYGDHPGTTGAHLAAAAETAGLGYGRPHPSREHARLTQDVEVDGALWVESGTTSVPLDSHRVPSPTAGYLIDTHLHLRQSILQAQLFDVAFVAQRDDVARVEAEHPNVRWLPLAAPASFVTLPRESVYPVSFIGNTLFPPERAGLLTAVNRKAAMNDWRRFHHVAEMGDVYRRSRIVLNPPARGDLNMRFFEAMACGAVVVTPPIDNGLRELAGEDEHYLTADFTTATALADAIGRLLDADLAPIGERARELVGGAHTWDHRIATVADALASCPLDAPVRSLSDRDRGQLLVSIAAEVGDISLLAQGLRSAPVSAGANATVRTLRRGTKSIARDLSPTWFVSAYRSARYGTPSTPRPPGS